MLPKRAWTYALLAALAITAAPREARADDAPVILVTGSALGATTLSFWIYTVVTSFEQKEPNVGWMTAQAVVMSAQTAALGGVLAWLSYEDDEKLDALIAALGPTMVISGTLASFSVWSLAEPGETSVKTRLLLSLVGGTNFAFSSIAVGHAARGRFSPFFVSIPQACLTVPAAVFAGVQAHRDEDQRVAWGALSTWSGLLAVHGVASIIGKATDADDAGDRSGLARSGPPPALVPIPMSDGSTIVPGMGVAGAF